MPLGESFDRVLDAARAGAEWAWTALYRDLAPALLGYLRARGATEPEDLVGQVFVDVVRGLPGFRGGEREFRAWVFMVAHRDLQDERRRLGRRRTDLVPTEAMERSGPIGDVEEEAMGTVAAERVRRIISRLSPSQRDVLALRIFGDLTIEQTARILRKRPGAVKALQRRALAAALRELSREGVPL